MLEKFSPGPWTKSKSGGKVYRRIPSESNYSVTHDILDTGRTRVLADETVEANAALAAAAPDLYEVARLYEKWEADLVLCEEAWAGELPIIPQVLWDRFISIQQKRVAALEKALTV